MWNSCPTKTLHTDIQAQWRNQESNTAHTSQVKQDYLEVKELAVSSVDDVGRVVRICDIDEIHLPKEERMQIKLKAS